jgi:catechol 2,3-dioxygenase-like lactoylglutathione lyase family enzyme
MTVDDFDAAVALYRDALGMAQVADWSSADGRVVVLSAERATLELFDAAQASYVDRLEAGRRVSGTVRLAFEVDDADATSDRMVGSGASRVAPPVDTPWGDRNARLESPEGVQLTLFAPAGPRPPSG